uniref:cytochrome c oxidase subunit III n=1 Tax=Corynosoma villosum TaxID=141829 RepID=UPI002E78B0C2|nr:cytochrome c oxidase subunit III [Corynosoma villosum]WPN89827.1 cytochrome c oxidase subunit III [Corynosoma villosum]
MVLVISVWPLVVSWGILMVVVGVCTGVLLGGVVGLMFMVGGLVWWVCEDQVKGLGSVLSQYFLEGSGMAILIFIFSEFMFFLSLLVSSVYMVEMWDPIVNVDMYGVPMLISVVLLSSGVTMTLGHQMIHSGMGDKALKWVALTVVLGVVFVSIQVGEWYENSFSFFDGVGGSMFYFITGFHGMHVIMGVVLNSLLFVMLVYHLSGGYISYWKGEGVVWYWHFVDVVWMFVYLGVYWYCM